jgi:hypothetical protein
MVGVGIKPIFLFKIVFSDSSRFVTVTVWINVFTSVSTVWTSNIRYFEKSIRSYR